MQIDLAKTVAAQAATAFQTVPAVMDWPAIIRSISSIEALTPGRGGKTLQPLMSPFMAIALRDELENDLSDLAAAIPRTANRKI